MKNIAFRPRLLAAVAVATVACLMIVSMASVQAVQSATQNEELSRMIAELTERINALVERLDTHLADLDSSVAGHLEGAGERLQAELAEMQARREGDMTRVRSELREAMVDQADRVRAVAEEQARAATMLAERRAQESRLVQERARRALESAQFTSQRSASARAVGWGSCGTYGEDILDRAEDLSLSDDQIEQIRSVERAARRQGIERNADIEVAQMDLEALYEAEEPDLAAIRGKLEELAGLDVDRQIAGLSLRQQVRQVLTAEQRQQLEEIRGGDDVRIVISGTGNRRLLAGFGC